MKRICCLMLLCSLLLSGCGLFSERLQEPVRFYYIRSGYQQDMASVIVSEEREAAGHRNDLSYLLALYLMGPTEEEHVSPLPRGTNIFRTECMDSSVVLTLSDTERTMTDIQFTLACTCLTLTCMDLTDADTVTVTSGARSVTLTRDNLILFDSTTSITTEAVK